MIIANSTRESHPNAIDTSQSNGNANNRSPIASSVTKHAEKQPSFISDYLGLPHQHSLFAFVDTRPEKDTKIFIDPCLIEAGTSGFCNRAHYVVDNYFDVFYSLFKRSATRQELLELFMHTHEINAAKLGYGNGRNGKAKTPDGMLNTFSDVHTLFKKGLPLSTAIDLPIFIEGFAEDCMTDLLTNILFLELNQFTLEQCALHGYHGINNVRNFYYWDASIHSWKEYTGPMMIINESPILLVPKEIVRPSYYCDTEHFIRHEITERIRLERMQVVKGKEVYPNKKDLRDELGKKYGSGRIISIEEVYANPFILTSYHDHIPHICSNMTMTDDQLDNYIYRGHWNPKKGKYKMPTC